MKNKRILSLLLALAMLAALLTGCTGGGEGGKSGGEKTDIPAVTFPLEDRRAEDVLTARGEAHRKLLYDFAAHFSNSYVIDLWQYAPVYDAAFRKQFFMGGHMSPTGYAFTAKLFLSYIDWIIRHNMADFKQVGFIGTGLKNTAD